MGRTIYIVARDHPELFAYLRDRLACEGETDVIQDRRVSQRRQQNIAYVPERRVTERRLRPDVDVELQHQLRSHAIITVPEGVPEGATGVI